MATDLTELVECLRRAHFRVDTRQYLLAHELLLGLAARGQATFDAPPARLAAYLGPIFCTSPDEQDRFLAVVSEWRKVPLPPPDQEPQPARPPIPYWRRWRWALIGLAVFLPLAAIGGAYGYYFYGPLTLRGEVTRRLPSGQLEPVTDARIRVAGVVQSVDSAGRFTIRVARARTVDVIGELESYQSVFATVSGVSASPISLTFEPATEPVDVRQAAQPGSPARIFGVSLPVSAEASETDWRSVVVGALSVGALVWMLLWLFDRLRRRLALERLPTADDPELITLHPERPATPITNEKETRRAALSLRRARDEADQVLNLARTLDLSVRNGGFFTPQFAARRSVPEYLVLIQRRAREDHHAHVVAATLEILRSQDVPLYVYWFREDPRTCLDDGRTPHRLAQILKRHHRATLVVCAETASAFSASAGSMLPWVQMTSVLATRVFLTPEPPYRWAHRERALLDTGFVVLPANESGWQQLGELPVAPSAFDVLPRYARALPSLLSGSDRRWLDRNEPSSDIVDRLLRQVEAYLGSDGFAWLCACAIYPEISWPLTLRLGPAHPSPDLLRALARLPWLRGGYMPDWLRRKLVERIAPAEDRRLRRILEELIAELGDDPQPDGRSALTIGRLVAPLDLLHAAPPDSPLSDQILLGFIAGVRPNALTLFAPRNLLRLFTRRPGEFVTQEQKPRVPLRDRLLSPFRSWMAYKPSRLRWSIAFLLTLLAGSSLAGTLTVARVSDYRAPIWFIEVPRQELRFGDGTAGGSDNPLDVRTFFISRTEITVAQYRACVEENACKPADATALSDPDDWPVRRVSWVEAMQYCAWLENRLKAWADTPADISDALLGRYKTRPWSVTLPSEPEWELAARGTDGRRFPWGDATQDYMAYSAEVSRGTPTAVGSYPIGASPIGALDMAGNLSEWTRSPFAASPQRPDSFELSQQNPIPELAIRGGSFDDRGDNISAIHRSATPPGSRTPQLGFRAAISSLVLTEGARGPGTMTPVDISTAVNAPIDWLTVPPRGQLTSSGVPLRFVQGAKRAIALSTSFRDGFPDRVDLGVRIQRPTAVHILMAGAWVVDLPRGTRVGRVTLQFARGSTSYDLIAGVNLRESWEYRNAITRLSPEGVEGAQWRNAVTEDQLRASQPAVAYLDLLSLDVPTAYLGDVLTGIVLEDLTTSAQRRADRTTETAPVNPSFTVSAITVESSAVTGQ